MNTIINFIYELPSIIKDNQNMFYLCMLLILGFWINTFIATYRGRDHLIIQVIDRIKDLISYLFNEMRGDTVQKINALFGILVFIATLVSIGCMFYEYFTKSYIGTTIIVMTIVFFIVFVVTLPICTRYTRTR